ncbi:MAG TPA: hypothetical protein VK587_03310, partial [bacterium]|nr:hypothetical protein [bacterium]
FQTSGYAGGGGLDLNTPVLMAGGSIGACATGCVNSVTYNGVPNNMVYVYGSGYATGAGAPVCGTLGSSCNAAYILPPYAAQSSVPCGTATVGSAAHPATLYVKGMVYVLANRDRQYGAPALGVDAYSTYGWCVGADANDTVAIQGSLVGEQIYSFEGQMLWDPSMHFAGFNGNWTFCNTDYSKCAALSNANPLTAGSVTIIPLSESTGQ